MYKGRWSYRLNELDFIPHYNNGRLKITIRTPDKRFVDVQTIVDVLEHDVYDLIESFAASYIEDLRSKYYI